ncbi:MAG: hypothetical protein M9961_18175 [Ilumatobacteraceae bacterium]|nr:hypothetical protein [Ilumatobacteraceae bacterium]
MKVQSQHRLNLAAAVFVAAATGFVLGFVVAPRLAQLRTATTGTGGATLVLVGVLLGVAALAPMVAVTRATRWKVVAVSIVAIVLGAALVLSFNERNGSDGLFMFPLLLGSSIIVTVSGLLTVRLGRNSR